MVQPILCEPSASREPAFMAALDRRGFKWPGVSRDNEVHGSRLSSDI